MARKERVNPIKYGITLVPEQKKTKELILANEIVIVTGNPGSGKSSVVAQTVLDLLFSRSVSEIILTRPTIEVGKSLGLLPGEKEDKLAPYLKAFIKSLHKCYPHREKLEKELKEGKIYTEALQFIRGENIEQHQIIICDEAQNTTKEEMEALLTRAAGGKIVVLGDLRQKDIKVESGLGFALDLQRAIPEIKHVHLVENHRSGVVKKIIDYIYGEEEYYPINAEKKEM